MWLASLLFPLAFLAADGSIGTSLPPIPQFLEQVRQHQRQLDKARESYTFRELRTIRQLRSDGGVKKEEKSEFNVFFVNGHLVQKLVRKDGVALAGDGEAQETAHVLRKIKQAQETPPGDPLNHRHEVSVSRLLAIERFSNERRVTMDNRPMIALDFMGDPRVDTHGVAEEASKHLSGTLWIDEKDQQVRRVQARLETSFHVELGLVSLDKGSSFVFEQKIVNNEVWLPTGALLRVEAHAALLLGYHIEVTIADDQYRRFSTSAEQQAQTGAPK